MGQLATQAQNAQIQTMNPQKNMKSLLERSWPRIAAVIGNNLSPQRLYQMYVSTINREPQLANCGVESVLSCFMKCAALGLEPSNVDGLGRAYILPYGNKNYRTGQKEATLIIGYKGMIDLARRSGQIRDISARAVHEGDEFTYSYGLNEDLRHVPCAKPGKLTHVYMIANFKDGGHYFQVMNADEIEAAAKRSPSYGKAVSPWKSDYEAMAKKTVIRRAFPYLPVSVEARDASHPTGVRGLKLVFDRRLRLNADVAPHWGAWIEIPTRDYPHGEYGVAPHWGAWIEMSPRTPCHVGG